MNNEKIKKAVIREDLLSITGDFRKAILLNQFIYWSERVSDADKFIEKENEIARNNGEETRELFYGWIYKTAEELADEVMLGLSTSQIRRYINDLVDLGYLSKRNNPKYKWDRTLQYRVNLVNIAKDLKAKGYPLSDYKIDVPDDENTIAHGCAINEALVENQSETGERAIPETINRDYLNNSPTELNSFSNEKDNPPTGLNSPSSPKGGKGGAMKSRADKDKWIITKNHIISAMGKLGYGENDRETENAIDVIKYYYRKYHICTGENHPRLNNESMFGVLDHFVNGPDALKGYETDPDTYMLMIDKHFKTKYHKKIDWNIQHFMLDTIRENLFYQTCD